MQCWCKTVYITREYTIYKSVDTTHNVQLRAKAIHVILYVICWYTWGEMCPTFMFYSLPVAYSCPRQRTVVSSLQALVTAHHVLCVHGMNEWMIEYLGFSPSSSLLPSICIRTLIKSAGLARNWPAAPDNMPQGRPFLSVHTHKPLHLAVTAVMHPRQRNSTMLQTVPQGKGPVQILPQYIIPQKLVEDHSWWIHYDDDREGYIQYMTWAPKLNKAQRVSATETHCYHESIRDVLLLLTMTSRGD